LITIFSCGRKLVPVKVTGVQGEDYDVAAFNLLYVEAIKAKLMGNEADALKYFEQCLKIKQESDASYYQMAQILISNGDIINGKKYAKKAFLIDSDNVWYLMMLAGIYYQANNLDSAIIYYDKAVNYYPDRLDLKFNLGNLYSEKRDFNIADSIFEALDVEYGINESSTVSLIRNLMEENKYDEALVKAEMLREKYPEEILYDGLLAEIYRGSGKSQKAIEVYNKLIERNPNSPQTQLSLCNFLLTEKNYDELFMLLNTVILNNQIVVQDKITLMGQLLETPDLIKTHSNNFYMTLMVFEATYKENDIIVLLRPELLIKQQKLKEASILLEEIIEKNPENYYAWEKLLLVYLEIKDYAKLLIKGEECATRFNRSFLVKILYANGAIEVGKYDIALEELRKAEILAGDNKEMNSQVVAMKADIYYRMKDYEKAFQIFELAIQSDSEDLIMLNNYAYYLAEQNVKLKEAEKLAKKVIEIEKNNNTYMDTYAWILYKRGKIKEATRIMEGIISSGEKPNAEWYEHYGFILKKQKKCPEAINNWNIAISIDSTKTELIKEIEDCQK